MQSVKTLPIKNTHAFYAPHVLHTESNTSLLYACLPFHGIKLIEIHHTQFYLDNLTLTSKQFKPFVFENNTIENQIYSRRWV